jgi:UDP-glucose 4-epimerase
MKNILLTGGAGFIGTKLSKFLLEKQYNVTVLDDLSTGLYANIDARCNFIQGCITSKKDLQNAFNNVDGCIHLAAIPSVENSLHDWSWCNKVNLYGTINVFDIASKLNTPVIYSSSAAVYGNHKQLPLLERNSSPITPYGLDKLTCERQAKLFEKYRNLQCIGLRFFNVYGSGQNENSLYSGVISIFMRAIMNNQTINIHGDGSQKRDFIYIDDVVDSIYKSIQLIKNKKYGRVYNVCSGRTTSILELAEAIYDIIGTKRRIIFSQPRSGDIYSSVGNPNLAKQHLGFAANYDVKTGLRLLYKSLLIQN